MARIRSTKPEFWLDRKLSRLLSRDERMLYMGLWNQSDEHSRALGDPNVVKGAIFPYDSDLTVEVIDAMIDRLDYAGVAVRYEVDGDPYLFLPKLADHQRLEPGKVRSRYPEPPASVVARPSRVDEPVVPVTSQVSDTETDDPDPTQIVSDESAKTVAGSEKKVASLWSMEHGACSSSSSAPPPTREDSRSDVEALCVRLRDRIVANGSKATISGKWRTEARLLVDRDGRDVDKALNLIDWCQADPFWRSNVLSMRTFRAKYDQLRLKALEEHQRGRASPPNGLSKREQKIAAAERFKSNPNPELLRRAGLDARTDLTALPEGIQ